MKSFIAFFQTRLHTESVIAGTFSHAVRQWFFADTFTHGLRHCFFFQQRLLRKSVIAGLFSEAFTRDVRYHHVPLHTAI